MQYIHTKSNYQCCENSERVFTDVFVANRYSFRVGKHMNIHRAKQGRQGTVFRDWAITSIMNEINFIDSQRLNITFIYTNLLKTVCFWQKQRLVALKFNKKRQQSADANVRHIG